MSPVRHRGSRGTATPSAFTARWVARRDAVPAWWTSLPEHEGTSRPNRYVAATLLLAAAVVIASMPLVWHHIITPAHVYYGVPIAHPVDGFAADSWFLVAAAAALALAVWTFVRHPTTGVRWMVSVVAFALVNGMFFDYFDWSSRGQSADVVPYFGPGFYVGLAGAALAVAAAVLAWRSPD